MAYDEGLAERVRGHIAGLPGISERKMFGGLCFMAGGNMFAGIVGDELMARLPKHEHAEALGRPGARPMDFTGRPMAGFVLVDQAAITAEGALARWLDQCYAHAATLPAKHRAAKPRRTKKTG
jgi:TfoX/Sxy family transcriptional regulator of competence genes